MAPAKPGAQIAQAVTEALPVPDVVTPIGQGAQLDAPALPYLPSAQAVQRAAPEAE